MNKKQEISYTIGRLASKLGMSITPLQRHLEASDLIADCYRDEQGWLRIPYSVAIRLTGGNEKALAIQKPTRRKGRQRIVPEIEQLFEQTPKKKETRKKRQTPRSASSPSSFRKKASFRKTPSVSTSQDRFAYYQEVGRMLAKAGVTVKDIMSMYDFDMTQSNPAEEITDEPQQNHHSGDEDTPEQGQD